MTEPGFDSENSVHIREFDTIPQAEDLSLTYTSCVLHQNVGPCDDIQQCYVSPHKLTTSKITLSPFICMDCMF